MVGPPFSTSPNLIPASFSDSAIGFNMWYSSLFGVAGTNSGAVTFIGVVFLTVCGSGGVKDGIVRAVGFFKAKVGSKFSKVVAT